MERLSHSAIFQGINQKRKELSEEEGWHSSFHPYKYLRDDGCRISEVAEDVERVVKSLGYVVTGAKACSKEFDPQIYLIGEEDGADVSKAMRAILALGVNGKNDHALIGRSSLTCTELYSSPFDVIRYPENLEREIDSLWKNSHDAYDVLSEAVKRFETRQSIPFLVRKSRGVDVEVHKQAYEQLCKRYLDTQATKLQRVVVPTIEEYAKSGKVLVFLHADDILIPSENSDSGLIENELEQANLSYFTALRGQRCRI